jgi:RNA polymerase sigma-70 factor (ECF subfamily)
VQDPDDLRRLRFDALFAAHSSDVVAYCGWRATSTSDAQDAVAEVFLIAWRRFDELPEGDGARVWLYATARRVLANQRRSSRRREALRERLEREPPAHVRDPLDAEATLVREALMRLGQRDREVLLLSVWEGLAPAEIAEVLGCLTVTARGGCIAPAGGSATPSRRCRRRRPLPATPASFKENTSMSDSFEALRRANPRARAGFTESVEAATRAARAQIATAPAVAGSRPRRRRRLVAVALAGVPAAAGAAAVFAVALSGGGSVVQSAYAALKEAASVTADTAERSGTARLRITHDGEMWGDTTVRWGGGDIAIINEDRPRRSGGNLLLVDGTIYGQDGRGGWLNMGDPSNIVPDSGTTPDEYLAAVREESAARRFAGSPRR